MPQTTKDPLLAVARFIIATLIGILSFAGIMVAIGVGAVLTVGSEQLRESIADADLPSWSYGWVVFGIAAIAVAIFLWVRFLMELRETVITVDEGDPFIDENADRLSRMGWIVLAIQLIVIPLGIGGKFLREAGDDEQIVLGESGGGLMLVLTLFILARVFRLGAEMRRDLEGTV